MKTWFCELESDLSQVSRTWLSTTQVRSQISAFHIEGQYEKQNLAKTDTGTLLLLLLIPVSVCSASSSRIPEESTSLGLRGRRVQNGRDGALGLGNAFFRLKKASFRILFLRCELRLILFFTGEGKGDLDPLYPKWSGVSKAEADRNHHPGIREFWRVQNSGLDWWYLLIPSFGSHSSVVGVRRERAQSAWAHCFHSAVDLAKARAQRCNVKKIESQVSIKDNMIRPRQRSKVRKNKDDRREQADHHRPGMI